MHRSLVVIAHDIRSAHNVGSLLRTADGLGVDLVIFSGYTPYPLSQNDDRLAHLAQKTDRAITKTALGAEKTVHWTRRSSLQDTLSSLRHDGYTVVALEQSPDSQPLPGYQAPEKLALVLGNEVTGLDATTLTHCDLTLEIPMLGAKESYNVVQAAAMALYQFRFY